MKANQTLSAMLSASVFAVTLLSASLAQAAVTLQVDDNIKVTAINGQELNQGLFQPLQQTFTLEPGNHVITAKYDRLFEFANDKHDYLRSKNISVAATMQDNQTYRLTMPGQPTDYQAAKSFAEQPKLAIQLGDTVISEQQAAASQGGLFSGLGSAIGGMFGMGESAKVSNDKAIAALENSNTASTTAVSQTQAIRPVSTAATNNTLDAFMQLWLQATPAERAKIRQWVAE